VNREPAVKLACKSARPFDRNARSASMRVSFDSSSKCLKDLPPVSPPYCCCSFSDAGAAGREDCPLDIASRMSVTCDSNAEFAGHQPCLRLWGLKAAHT